MTKRFTQNKIKIKQRGFSVLELLIVVLISALVATIAIPQINQARMLTNFNNLSVEILGQMRRARQMAISERQDFTFRYNNATKQIQIIDRGERNLATSVTDRVVATINLEQYGLKGSDITYGVVPSLNKSSITLDDGCSTTPLPSNSLLEIVFRPDGSVTDAVGNPLNNALFFYSAKQPDQTGFAVSVLGASGRARAWKFNQLSKKWND